MMVGQYAGRKIMIDRWLTLALAAVALMAGGTAFAQNYPTKTIRIVVPFAPGGNVDINARAIAPGMSELLGQSVVVDNRGGAGGMIGAELVAKSAPDGYTLMMASNSVYSVAPSVYSKPLYHPIRDFTAISALTSVPFVLVIHPSVPAKTFREFVAIVKSQPGKMTLANAGFGTSNHLVGELMQIQLGTKMASIPYKGSGPALIDLLGGQVDAHVDQLTASMGHIKSGRIRALAVTTDKRSTQLPMVPTLAESGLKGFDATTATGLMAPAGTPKEIIERLSAAAIKVVNQPLVKSRFAELGADTIGSTPAEFAAYIKDDFAKWYKVVKDAGITVD
jgi:tripartite-type tricarboxylate transporter receptor subunit TctC